MITILAAAAICAHGRNLPSVVGEWRAWRIMMGDSLVSPPTIQKGRKLFLTSGGQYTLLFLDGSPAVICRGTYAVRGNKIHFDREGHDIVPNSLLVRHAVLWDNAYLMGMGSFVYDRPGKMPAIPKSDKDWPSFDDWGGFQVSATEIQQRIFFPYGRACTQARGSSVLNLE